MNKDKRNNIQLLGTLNNADESGIIANANQIYDDVQQKAQETINSELIAAVGTEGSVDTRITNAVNAEKTRAEGAESTLDGKITAEQTRAANAENTLDGRVDTLEEAVGTGGSVDSRIASAVATETSRAQDVSKEHTERIKTLEDKENSMQTTLENITKTGEASAASNVTYNHSDSKLDATNIQQAIDEVRKRSNYNDGDEVIDFNTIHLITDNPEFVCVAVDVNEKILYGIKTDGQPYFGVGCPQQVKDYVNEQINKILGTDDISSTIDSLKEIEAFLKDFTNSDTLKNLLDTKVDKEEGKSLIDAEFSNNVSYEENPEFATAEVDSEKKLLGGRKLNGIRFEKIGFETPLLLIGENQCYTYNDPENRETLIIDKDNKIVSFRDKNGVLHENAGIETTLLNASNLILSEEGVKNLIDLLYSKGLNDKNNWKNKNIAYFGTSVPAQGYPQIVGAKLGANVYNQAIGSSMMRCGLPTTDYINHNELGDDLGLGGIYFGNIMRSMSRTQKELRYIFDNWTDDRRKANLIAKGYTAEQVANVKGYSYYIGGSFPEEQTDPTTPQGWPSSKPVDVYAGDGETYKTFRQMAYSYCWDNSEDIESDLSMSGAITGTIKGRMQKFIDGEINTDLFVFDHFRNDCIDSTSSQYLEIPQNPLDRNYAEGAFNYLVSQILLVKPNAKIVIVGHIDNDDTKAQLGHVWEAQEIAANRWGIPLLKLWELLGVRAYKWVTTTGYWDANGVWHESGYNGSNHVWHSNNGLSAATYENPRQIMINGVNTWVHNLTTRMIWLKDDIHPTGTLALNHFATIIASWLKTI